MSRSLAERLSISTAAESETEPEFRREIDRLSRNSMLVAGFLGVAGSAFLLVARTVVQGLRPALTDRPSVSTGLWDELSILVIGLLTLALTRTRIGARFGRLIVAVVLLFAAFIVVLDDALKGVDTSSTSYLALLMVVGVGTVPFRPWHTFTLGLGMIAVYRFTMSFYPELMGFAPVAFGTERLIFLFLLVLLCTWISGLLYNSRYRMYLASAKTALAERKYHALFENSSDAIFVIDNATNRFLEANPTFQQLTGIPTPDLQMVEFHEIVDPTDRNRVIEYHRARLRGDPAPTRYMLKILTRTSAEPRVCDLTIHRSDDRRVTAGVGRDLTERIQAEEKIRRYAEELEDTNKHLRATQAQLVQSEKMAALGDLVGGVLHEINTPIGSIQSNADLMGRAIEILEQTAQTRPNNGDEESVKRRERAYRVLKEATETNRQAVKRVNEVTFALRNFARAEESELQTVDLHESLDATLTLMQHELGDRIEVVRDYGDLPPIQCFAAQINQVFMILLSNAVHAISESGQIRIKTRRLIDRITAAIKDTGCGIVPEQLNHLFDPKFSLKDGRMGMGLGLPIAYQIIDSHHGTIDVSSAVGQGSSFTVALPLTQSSSSDVQLSETRQQSVRTALNVGRKV